METKNLLYLVSEYASQGEIFGKSNNIPPMSSLLLRVVRQLCEFFFDERQGISGVFDVTQKYRL